MRRRPSEPVFQGWLVVRVKIPICTAVSLPTFLRLTGSQSCVFNLKAMPCLVISTPTPRSWHHWPTSTVLLPRRQISSPTGEDIRLLTQVLLSKVSCQMRIGYIFQRMLLEIQEQARNTSSVYHAMPDSQHCNIMVIWLYAAGQICLCKKNFLTLRFLQEFKEQIFPRSQQHCTCERCCVTYWFNLLNSTTCWLIWLCKCMWPCLALLHTCIVPFHNQTFL